MGNTILRSLASRSAAAGALAALLLAACAGERPDPLPDAPWIQRSATSVVFEQTAFVPASLAPVSAAVRLATGGRAAPAGAPSASVRYGEGDGWLVVEVREDAAGWEVSIRPEGIGAFETGTYAATVEVAWEGASNSPAQIEITLVVGPHPGLWSPGQPSVAASRHLHTTTALADGGALAAGGRFAEDRVERLDPATGRWSELAGLQRGRQEHTATLLEDGKVLLAGGRSEVPEAAPPGGTWELYDPAAGVVVVTGTLREERYGHAAVLLLDGRVLLVGGRNAATGAGRGTRSAEVFDPRTRQSVLVGALHGDASTTTAAVLLADGCVLVTNRTPAGVEVGAELLDPSSGVWTPVAPRRAARREHALVALADGRAVALGGFSGDGAEATQVLEAEAYDPATGLWAAAGWLQVPHAYARDAAVRLPSGKVLVAGGLTAVELEATTAVEVFDPEEGAWSVAGTLGAPRGFHTVTLLGDGRLVAVGGWPDTGRPEGWREPAAAETP